MATTTLPSTPPSNTGAAPRASFGLRPKLALGFGGLLLVLLATGWQGIALLDRLGGSIDIILRENYRSVVAAQDMKEALERIDSGALFALAGEPERGRRLAAEHRASFEEALAIERGNLTLPGEGSLAERVARLYGRYAAVLPAVLDSGLSDAERRAVYFRQLLPLFQGIKGTATDILRLNQANMVEANAQARALAASARRRMVLLLAVGTLLAAGLVVFLSQAILRPLGLLTRSAREIERGNLDLVVPVGSRDELGQLAAAFNAMASRLRELRRSDQAKLLRAQRTSQQAIDSLPDAVAVFSPEGEVELANQTARTALGLAPGEPVPESHAAWLLPLLARTGGPGVGGMAGSAGSAGASRATRGYDSAVQLFLEGRERFFLPQAVAVHDPHDPERLQGITLILADVTDLRRLDEIKSGLVSTVSHELRTPLTSVQMALHVLLDESSGPLTAQQTELLLAARDDAERLREIIVNLLEISRLEQSSRQLRLQPTAPRDFVEAATERLRPAAADGGVELAAEIDPAASNVLVDRPRARLVLTNLLDNALHHTAAGGRIVVRAAPAEEGRRVRFEVTDTGRGIPAEAVSRVFERFYQVPGTEDAGGAGLGLSIAKEIVQAHGGEIGCRSDLGRGTTFWFDLPATEGAAAPLDSTEPAASPEERGISLL